MYQGISVIRLVMFIIQDEVIKEENTKYKVTGGCTAVVCLFFMGKLYVANAGDSRAVLIHNNEIRPLSNDFTPESDRQRVQHLVSAYSQIRMFDTYMYHVLCCYTLLT